MGYKVAADIVVVLHFLWILFLVVGGIPGVRRRWVRILHGGGLLFALTIQIAGWYCPLTHLETWLRERHDPDTAYAGSFLIHYIERLVYLDMDRSAVLLLTLALCGLYSWLYLKTRRRFRT